jgi:O-antigen/teichoic acid export membrane protein
LDSHEIWENIWAKNILIFSTVAVFTTLLAASSAGWPETILGQHRLECGKVPGQIFARPMQKVFRNSIFSNSIAVLLLRGTTIFSRIAALLIIAKFTSNSEFGVVSIAVALAEIGKVAADFGTDTLALKEYAIEADPSRLRKFAKTTALTKLFCCLLVYAGLAAYFLATQPPAAASIGLVAGLLLITTSASNFSINYFQARLRILEILWPIVANNILTVCLVALALHLNPNPLIGVAILPCAEAVNALILHGYFAKQVSFWRTKVNRADILALLQKGLPIAISIMLVAFYSRLDVIVLERFGIDKAAIGDYGVAFRCTEPFQLVTSAFAITAYSHLSAILTNREFSAANRFILRYGSLIFTYGLAIGCLLMLLAPPLIEYFLPQYQASIPILRILAAAIIFRTPTASLTCMIQAYGYYRWITYVSAWNLSFIAALLWLLVPRMSEIGAAYALLIGEVVNAAIQGAILWQISRRQIVL